MNKEFCVRGSKPKTVLYCSYSTTGCEQCIMKVVIALETCEQCLSLYEAVIQPEKTLYLPFILMDKAVNSRKHWETKIM